jgi:hypothetical protein
MANTPQNMICLAACDTVCIIMDGMFVSSIIYTISNKTVSIWLISHHAGAPPSELAQIAVVPASAYAAALKEYEDDTGTDSEGEMMLVWWYTR